MSEFLLPTKLSSSNDIWNLIKVRKSVDERSEGGRWISDNVCLGVHCELYHHRHVYSFIPRFCW
jgi:hypothetical protein